jgi:hypothetical protein
MDNPRIKVWPTLTRIYHQYIVKFVQSISTIWMKRNEVKETVLFSALQHLWPRAPLSYLITEWRGILSSAYLSVFPKTFF